MDVNTIIWGRNTLSPKQFKDFLKKVFKPYLSSKIISDIIESADKKPLTIDDIGKMISISENMESEKRRNFQRVHNIIGHPLG